MKKRNLLPGFALAALMMLGLAGTAHAQEGPYTCNEGINPPPYSEMPLAGGLNINDLGATCTLGNLSAAGSIGITATNITAGNIQSGAGILMTNSGYMTTGSVESTGDSYIGSTGDVTIN